MGLVQVDSACRVCRKKTFFNERLFKAVLYYTLTFRIVRDCSDLFVYILGKHWPKPAIPLPPPSHAGYQHPVPKIIWLDWNLSLPQLEQMHRYIVRVYQVSVPGLYTIQHISFRTTGSIRMPIFRLFLGQCIMKKLSTLSKQVSWRFLNSFYNIFSLPYIVPVYHRAICRPLDRPEKRPRAEIRAWDERHGKMPIVAELVSPGWNCFEFVFCKYIIFWFKRISVNPLTIDIVVK